MRTDGKLIIRTVVALFAAAIVSLVAFLLDIG